MLQHVKPGLKTMPKTSLAVLFIVATLLSTASANIMVAKNSKVYAENWTNIIYQAFPDGYVIGRACKVYRDTPYGGVYDIYFWASNSSPHHRLVQWEVWRGGQRIFYNSSSTWLYGTEIRNQAVISILSNDRFDLRFIDPSNTIVRSVYSGSPYTVGTCW